MTDGAEAMYSSSPPAPAAARFGSPHRTVAFHQLAHLPDLEAVAPAALRRQPRDHALRLAARNA